jgi:hypothetical protein
VGWARALLDVSSVASGEFRTTEGGANTSARSPAQPPIPGWQPTPPQPTIAPGDEPLELLDVLDPAERQVVAARLVRELDAERGLAAAERVPGPWSREMDDAVLGALGREGQLVSKVFVELCRLAARRMAPSRAEELEDVVIGEWNRLMTYPGLGQFLDLIDFRRRMARAFAVDAPANAVVS